MRSNPAADVARTSPDQEPPERGQAPGGPPEEDGGSASNPARVSVRLLDSESDIGETLPLALAAHEESRRREYPLDPERRRRFLAERFLADRTRYGFLIAALRRPSGGDADVPRRAAALHRRVVLNAMASGPIWR